MNKTPDPIITMIASYTFNNFQPVLLNNPFVDHLISGPIDLENLITSPLTNAQRKDLHHVFFRLLDQQYEPAQWYRDINENMYFLNGSRV